MRTPWHLALLAFPLLLPACGILELSDENPGDGIMTTASEDTGSEDDSCSVDEDCLGRAQVCGRAGHCVEASSDVTTTCDGSEEPTFAARPLPFFRGEICTVKGRELAPKAAIPITLRTCHHACVTPGTDHFQPQWDCETDTCAVLVLAYSISDADACPPEAWGQFPKEECVWSEYTTMGVGPITSGGTPIEADVSLEVPYLSRQDLEAIVDYQALDLANKESQASAACSTACDGFNPDSKALCLDNCLIQALAFQYPQQVDRVLPFDLRNVHDDPPDTCGDGDPRCQCYTIGFG